MPPKSPLVPSKDVLRLLRQLAFAGSTFAAIGVVTLNYHVHRGIRLAEQHLETKKQIRALSGGRGTAHLARVIEAAENGEDFSIQAMREQRFNARRFEPSISTSLRKHGSREQEPTSSRSSHNGEGNHFDREMAARKIRNATITLTSTASAHVYGRPKRVPRPARYWPILDKMDSDAQEIPTTPGRNNTSNAYGEEAAQRIRKATMTMTSTPAAHVYARPKKAVPGARPNLHGSVASWLGTSLESQTPTDAADGLTVPSSNRIGGELTSRQSESATLTSGGCVEKVASEALDQPRSSAAEHETKANRTTGAGVFHGIPDAHHHQGQHMSEPSQFSSSKSSRRGDLSALDTKEQTTTPDHGTQWVDSIKAPQITARSQTTTGAINVPANTTNVTATSDEISDVGRADFGSFAFPVGKIPQGSKTEQVTLGKSSYTEQPLSSKVSFTARSQSPNAAGTNDVGSPPSSSCRDRATPEPKRRTHDELFQFEPFQQIQLQHSASEAHQPDFKPWPHLQSSHNSNIFEGDEDLWSLDLGIAEMRQEVSVEEQNSPKEEVHDQQHEVTQQWTPFPRSSSVPGRTNDRRNLEVDHRSGYTNWPPCTWEELHKSDHIPDASKAEAATMPVMTAKEKVDLALRIQRITLSDGLMGGERAWKAAASQALRHRDLSAVDFLYAEFVEKGVMSMSPRHYLVQSLVQWHFGNSKYSARAAEILFPSQIPSPANAMRFLQGLWESQADLGWLLINFRRVIVAAKLRGVKLIEEMFALMIRFLASAGEMTTAQAVYDEMVFYHQIDATFFSRTLLIRGYARTSDWNRVEREIESLHLHGLSRNRPHEYALMINSVLKEYAARASIEQFQNLLINAISYWGLVPTSSISITTVQAYLSRQRYDLVREWMDTLQVLFPQIETETSAFQTQLGNFWQRAGADCRDIEEAIKALAYRNPNTKMKSFSVPIIHEALSRDLASKLNAALAKTELTLKPSPQRSTESNDFVATKTLDQYLTSAFSLATSTILQNQKPTPEVINLHRQASAVHRVNTFLNSTTTSEIGDHFSFPDRELDGAHIKISVNSISAPAIYSIYHLRDTIPKILTAEFLPNTTTVTAAILDFYRTRTRQDLPTSHTLLPWVCEKLLHAGRMFDAVFVIQKVYGNKLVRQLAGLADGKGDGLDNERVKGQGAVAFGIQFFEFWMCLASATRSLVQWTRVADEVLRLSRPSRTLSTYPVGGRIDKEALQGGGLRITASFLFLTRVVAFRCLKGGRLRLKHERRTVPTREVDWLLKELEKRREQQIGRKEET